MSKPPSRETGANRPPPPKVGARTAYSTSDPPDRNAQQHQNENAARRVRREGVDRGQNPRADQKRPEQAEGEGDQRQQHGPAFLRFPPLDHDGRMKQRRSGQPRNKRGILDRIPEPPTAPAQFVIGPPTAEPDAKGQACPRGQSPRPDPARPGGIDPAFDQRGDGERKCHRETDVPEVEHRRVEREAGVLQQRIEAAPFERRRIDPQKRVRRKQNEQNETEADHALDGDHARPEPRRQIVAEERDGSAEDGQDRDPKDH